MVSVGRIAKLRLILYIMILDSMTEPNIWPYINFGRFLFYFFVPYSCFWIFGMSTFFFFFLGGGGVITK